MWIMYFFVLIFNMFFPELICRKYEVGNDIQGGIICGGPGDVTTNNGGPFDDEEPELPELP